MTVLHTIPQNRRDIYAELAEAPGRFTGLPLFVIFYDDLSAFADEVLHDETGRPVIVFHLSDDDYGAFPELRGHSRLYIFDDADYKRRYYLETIAETGAYASLVDAAIVDIGECPHDARMLALADARLDFDAEGME